MVNRDWTQGIGFYIKLRNGQVKQVTFVKEKDGHVNVRIHR